MKYSSGFSNTGIPKASDEQKSLNSDDVFKKQASESQTLDEIPVRTGSAGSSNISSTTTSSTIEPLTWNEARSRMRQMLTSYMGSSQDYGNREDISEQQSYCGRIINICFQKDIDCYFSILISLALLVFSSIMYANERKEKNSTDPGERLLLELFASHMIASCLLFLGSVLGTWLLKRRRYTSARGLEMKKRDVVKNFLPALDDLLENDAIEDDETHPINRMETKLSGNSLTDLYLVYRRSSVGSGKWHRVPSLLIVKGDFIAMQLGDTVPADCKLVVGPKIGPLSSHTSLGSLRMASSHELRPVGRDNANNREPIMMRSGDRVKPLHKIRMDTRNNQVCDHFFPPGKSALPEYSKKLMHLCNHSRVYQVVETPLETFLQKKAVPAKTPQIIRKFAEVRVALYFFSVGMLVISFAIVFVRNSIQDVNSKVFLHVPILITLSSLPISTPFIAILGEIIGTARIILTVHLTKSTETNKKFKLFPQYLLRGIHSRIKLSPFQTVKGEDNMIGFPEAQEYLFEKLGIVTVMSLVDDQLACDPTSTPQRLLIPSNNGLKLLDLFPKFDDDSDDESSQDSHKEHFSRRRARSFASSNDSDSDWGDEAPEENKGSIRNTKMLDIGRIRRRFKRKKNLIKHEVPKSEVQFEDPNWWYHLPSLKCVGLAGLLVDNKEQSKESQFPTKDDNKFLNHTESGVSSYPHGTAGISLVRQITSYYDRTHLRTLSSCIGFSQGPNSFGKNGDISSFEELRRIRVIATRLVRRRMAIDRHQISTEESKSWGSLRPDSTSVIVKDKRSQGYQLLTVGDSRVVTDLCTDSWQGESITPLSPIDRRAILEANKTWSLADLDVTAFSYTPVPSTYMDKSSLTSGSMTYLIDNRTSSEIPAVSQKDNGLEHWSLIKNQIFLGLLGSNVSPRKDTTALIDDCTKCGIRFVYFSPRNMRRTKELASQMGIDVAWNCAISLRSLDEGEETDEHRMTSCYADWDVNARLPHGVEDVKRHLEEVDNVPLLVSIFTDVTKKSTSDMISIFRSHGNDTILSLGLSHISQNYDAFSSSDLAIGDDVLLDEMETIGEVTPQTGESSLYSKYSLHPKEISFVTRIASHSCVFNMALGQTGLLNMEEIVDVGRAALTAGTNAGHFVIGSSISLSLTLFFCLLSISPSMPLLPGTAVVLYAQIYIPLIALSMTFSAGNNNSMTVVPPKNDETITFAPKERGRITAHMIVRALLPAIASQIVYLIAFGSFLLDLDPDAVEELCDLDTISVNWAFIVQCRDLTQYAGKASLLASSLMLAELTLCTILQSANYLVGNDPIFSRNLLSKNIIWFLCALVCIGLQIFYLNSVLEPGSLKALPWYFYLISFVSPILCSAVCELVKKRDKRFEVRAETFRRLQFETRLGMWSPK